MRRLVLIACAIAGATGLLVAGPALSDDGGPYEVRAIFDNASFLVVGEEIRVAGAKVGTVAEVEVTRPGETVSTQGSGEVPGKAAVVLQIDEPGFQDFRSDASCLIQPQSTLGEKFVGCKPTQPRAAGTEPPPPLEEIPEGQPGEGQFLLPLENNGKAVDLDLVNDIMREPYADRFRLILNDLGAGVAARGDELEEIVERANPALRQTNQVLAILRDQNRTLAELADESDTVLEPLARERQHITGFIRNSTVPAQATAERSGDLEAGLERFPAYLREIRSTMHDLRAFSDAGLPVVTDFGVAAPDVTRAQRALVPLAEAGTDSLISLGDASAESEDDIIGSDPVIKQVRDLARNAKPGAKKLNSLIASLDDDRVCVFTDAEGNCGGTTTGLRALQDFIFNTSAAVNGYDEYGHYLRTFALVTNCTEILPRFLGECTAKFGEDEPTTTSAAAAAALQERFEGGGRRSGGGAAEGTVSPENEPQPDATAPDREPDAAPGEGEPGELAPIAEGAAERRSTRAGRALLRFLVGGS